MAPRCPNTLDFEDLLRRTPPRAVVPVLPDQVMRPASFYARQIRAMALACEGKDRAVIAADAAAFTGETFPESMLNAYLSEARPSHTINAVRYAGLVHATQDARLVQLYAGLVGHVLVPEHMLPFIRVGMLLQTKDEAARQLKDAQAEAARAMGVRK